MAPVWADKYGRKYNYPPTKEEIELNEKLNIMKGIILKRGHNLENNQIKLPSIIIKPDLNGDPCVDDLDTKTNDSPDIMKIILIGVVVGVILGVFK